MSTLIYNGISIDLVKTHEVLYRPVLDDGGGYLYTHVSISISGMISPHTTNYVEQSGHPIHFDGALPTDSMQAIQHALGQPRATLVYDSGGSPGDPLITSPAPGMPCDLNNGPIPGPVRISRVDGTYAYHVNFSVETWVSKCPSSGETSESGEDPEALISNRFAQSHSIDELHYTTIHTVGQAFFRTDLLEKAQETADKYRDLLLPPVPDGFQRKGITIAITPSRNALTYQVVDREKAFDLGRESQILDCKASYQKSSTSMEGGMVGPMTLDTFNVTVLGNKNASNWELTKFCFRMAQTRLPIFNPDKGFLRQISVHQSLTDRQVSLSVTMQLNPAKNAKIAVLDDLALRQDQVFPDAGGRNPNFPNRRGSAGTYTNELLVSAWKAACETVPVPVEGKYESGEPEPYTSAGSPKVEVYTTPDLPSTTSKYSDSTTTRAYTDYAIETSHDTVWSKMQVPLAGPAGDPGDGSSGGISYEADQLDCAFLTLARPMHRRVVKWTAERVGELPDLPSPNTTDPNLVLVDSGTVKTHAPSLLPDGQTLCYRISGTYTFGLKRAPLDASQSSSTSPAGLPMGQMPWISLSGSFPAIPAGKFVSGIIDKGASNIPTLPTFPVGPDF